MFIIRKAKIADVQALYRLLIELAEQGLLLPRSFGELYDNLRDYYVAVPEAQPNVLAGACALHVCWEELGEIRSLAVKSDCRGHHLGQMLYESCQTEARDLGLTRLFVLTYIPEYFTRLGFQAIDKAELPKKIWAECLNCVKFPNCGEEALEKRLDD